MINKNLLAQAALILLLTRCISARGDETGARYIRPDAKTGSSQAVIVGDRALVYTAMISGPDLGKALDRLDAQLRVAKSDLSRIVKLNVYAASTEQLTVARVALAERMQALPKPAVSWVVSPLPEESAVAVDAVAMTGELATKVLKLGGGQSTVSPKGSRIYISGQAAQSSDLATATRQTLKSLRETLSFLKRTDADILQLKAFLSPMANANVVRREINKFYGANSSPPLVLVEWQSSPQVPIEIELVAWGGTGSAVGPLIEYLTPPNFTASPVFSRVVRIHRTSTIYISSLAAKGNDAADAVQQVFQSLQAVLKETGSAFDHLAKATYYVTDDETSRELGVLRAKLYTPSRPPAASKAAVTVAGARGERLVMDMIAVPAP